jgi:hypothetical protein
MKTLLMLAGLCLLPAVALAAPPVQAPTQAPKSVLGPTQAPKAAQAPAQAPKAMQAPSQAPLKTAQANSGYRTYSYQPGTMAPSGTYRSYNRQPRVGSGFHSADWKANGQW